MEQQIRKMQKEDWPAVRLIYEQAVQQGNSTFQQESPGYAEWDATHLPDCRFVLLDNQQVVGWCALSPTSTRAAYQGAVEVSIYFEAGYHHRGLGTTLLSYLCEESEKAGFWSLYAVIISNNEASIRLHKKCGFRVIGFREKVARDRFGVWQDTTLLERRSALY